MEEDFLLNGVSFTVVTRDNNDKAKLDIIIDNLIERYSLIKTQETYKLNSRNYKYVYDYNSVATCTFEAKLADENRPEPIPNGVVLDESYFIVSKKVNVAFSEQKIIPYEDIGTNIFRIKITAQYYTFHFNNLNSYQEMELLSYKGNTESDVTEVLDLYKKIYPNPIIDDSKSHVYMDFLAELKNSSLFSQTRYRKLSRKLQLYDTQNHEQYRLIQFHTKKDNKFYKVYKFEPNSEVLTVNAMYYKFTIYNVEDFVKQLEGHLVCLEDNIKKYKKDIPNLTIEEKNDIRQALREIDFEDDELISERLSVFIQKITGKEYLTLKRDKNDQYNHFYIFSKEDPGKVFIHNGDYDFYPVVDRNSNYFRLRYQVYDKDTKPYGIGLKNRDNVTFKVKDRLICTYHINQWSTTKQALLKKYNEKKKHKFTLADDSNDIKAVIHDFQNRYLFMKIKNKQLRKKIDAHELDNGITTKAKFLKEIKINKHITEYSFPLFSGHII